MLLRPMFGRSQGLQRPTESRGLRSLCLALALSLGLAVAGGGKADSAAAQVYDPYTRRPLPPTPAPAQGFEGDERWGEYGRPAPPEPRRAESRPPELPPVPTPPGLRALEGALEELQTGDAAKFQALLGDNTRRLRALGALAKQLDTLGGDAVAEREITDQMARELYAISQTYRALANEAPAVLGRFRAAVRRIEGGIDEAGRMQEDLQRETEQLKADLETAQSRRRDENLSEVERLKAQVDAESYRARLAMSGQFMRDYLEQMVPALEEAVAKSEEEVSRREVFLHALKRNAEVFEAAARIMAVMRDLESARGVLGATPETSSQIESLFQNWVELESLLNTLIDRFRRDSPGM